VKSWDKLSDVSFQLMTMKKEGKRMSLKDLGYKK